MTRSAFNPTDTPVVIDDEGRILPGLEHGPVDPNTDEVKTAVEQGRLLLDDESDTSPPPAAQQPSGDETKPPAKKATAPTPKEN